MSELYKRLSASEEKHAAAWEKKLEDLKAPIPARMPSPRARILIWLAKRFGPQFILPTIAGNEKADSNAYDGQPDEEARKFSRDEKSHARMLSVAANSTGGISGGNVAQLEGRHRAGGGNALRAAVLGANDGLVSILSLVMGVAGATNSNSAVLIAENPEAEQEYLALIYQSKGLPEDRARKLASHMMADKGSILDTLAREELGIDPEELGGSAYEAAFTSFFLFAVGAVFPIFPFLF